MDLTPDATRRFLLGMMSLEESRLFEKEWLDQGTDETVLTQLSLEDTFTLAFRGITSSANDPVDDPLELVDLMQRLSRLHAESTSRAEPAAPASEPVAPPAQLGVYQIRRELGRGGMGTVYEAVDTRLHRAVAIKVLNPERSDSPEARSRFLNEARAAANLENDHIVAVYDVGEWEGQLYFTMPCLKGQSLKDHIDHETRLPWQDAVRIGRQIALGLSAAHAQGIAHRDIKPENIWLEETDGTTERRVRILDFGVARFAENLEEKHTREGMILGTPAFMAPEQARGERGDERSDLFSLGVILYRLVTGQMPFQGGNILAILSSLAIDNPQSPSALNREIPPSLSSLIMSLLSKTPVHRPRSADDVVTLLENIGMYPHAVPAPRRQFPVYRFGLMLTVLTLIGGVFWLKHVFFRPEALIQMKVKGPNIVARFVDSDLVMKSGMERGCTLPQGSHRLSVTYREVTFETQPFEVSADEVTTVHVQLSGNELCVYLNDYVFEKWNLDPVSTLSPWRHGPKRGIYITQETRLEASDLVLLPNSELTLETYVTPEVMDYKRESRLFEMYWMCAIGISTEAKWFMYTYRDNLDSQERVVPKRRVHVAAVSWPTKRKLYLDGKIIAEDSHVSLRPFGRERKGMVLALGFEGTMEQVRISNVARYDAEFTPPTAAVTDKDTLALYPCDEGAGDVLHDRSGNDLHITVMRGNPAVRQMRPLP